MKLKSSVAYEVLSDIIEYKNVEYIIVNGSYAKNTFDYDANNHSLFNSDIEFKIVVKSKILARFQKKKIKDLFKEKNINCSITITKKINSIITKSHLTLYDFDEINYGQVIGENKAIEPLKKYYPKSETKYNIEEIYLLVMNRRFELYLANDERFNFKRSFNKLKNAAVLLDLVVDEQNYDQVLFKYFGDLDIDKLNFHPFYFTAKRRLLFYLRTRVFSAYPCNVLYAQYGLLKCYNEKGNINNYISQNINEWLKGNGECPPTN